MNLPQAIIPSFVNKNNYIYIAALFLCYDFHFASKDLVFLLLPGIILGFEFERI